ncbi:MAG: hypothetical protein GOMPHAMPRED_002062 [Gomphillus americanus]|uniref:Secreted protein n=1 Tax=Gomphillus americanus TaxID=1940652 RepID=A0A8H3F6M8_9LECA|nr:MAG: hypothetical protein GOMPHAMPRED_002062 [Gomphillus americanus]
MQLKLVTIYLAVLSTPALADPMPESHPAPIPEAAPAVEFVELEKRCVAETKHATMTKDSCAAADQSVQRSLGQEDASHRHASYSNIALTASQSFGCKGNTSVLTSLDCQPYQLVEWNCF